MTVVNGANYREGCAMRFPRPSRKHSRGKPHSFAHFERPLGASQHQL